MIDLVQYIKDHVDRGECKCGKCIDVGNKLDPIGHTADVYFFTCSTMGDPTSKEFTELIHEHKGEFNKCDPLDGQEHSYIELGGWIGDQGLALMFMGLGKLLGVFDLLTPKILPGLQKDLMDDMAGAGLITIKVPKCQKELGRKMTAIEYVAQITGTRVSNWKYIDGPDSGVGADFWLATKNRKLEAYVNKDQGEFKAEINERN